MKFESSTLFPLQSGSFLTLDEEGGSIESKLTHVVLRQIKAASLYTNSQIRPFDADTKF